MNRRVRNVTECSRQSVAVAALLVLAILTASRLANSAINEAAICEASKLAAAGKYGACRLQNTSKATAQQEAPFFEKCKEKLLTRWAKIETKGGGACPTVGDVEMIGSAVRSATEA